MFGYTLQASAQKPPSPSGESQAQRLPIVRQSVTVTAKLTPAEVEDGKINDVYEGVYKLQKQHDCAKAIDEYRSVVIPLAEKAKFKIPQSKFLYLSYEGIGECDLSLRRFAEAEQSFQRNLDYIPVWPGINDSDYPINYESIGIARIDQQNWKGADESLQQAIKIFDQQIERALHSDYSEWIRNGEVSHLKMSQAEALALLAVVYYREQRNGEALNLLEKAYDQATTFHASTALVKNIAQSGLNISVASGNITASAMWLKRMWVGK